METYYPPPKTRILIAATPELRDRFGRILGRHELTFVNSSAEAMKTLEERYGLVIISVNFDESNMFALLADIRGHSSYRKVPVLCVLGVRGPAITDIAVESLDLAVKGLRANGFLDLHHFEDDDEGNARIARIVDYLILINGDLQHIARVVGEPLASDRRKRAG